LLIPGRGRFVVAALVFSFLLLVVARLISPTPLPGLFLILVPAAMGLLFTGLIKEEEEKHPIG
jgi:hypothetical protein